MTKPELNDDELDVLFDAARKDTGIPTPDFLTRLETTAVEAFAPPQESRAHRAWFAQLHDALGGWIGVSGLATAAVAGVWIGVAPPEGIVDPVNLVTQLSDETVTFDGWLTSDADQWQEFEDG